MSPFLIYIDRMNRSYLFLIAGLMLFLIACSSAPSDITEDEAYAIMNEIIADDTLIMQDMCGTFANSTFSAEMQQEFTAEEIAFIERQVLTLSTPEKIKENKVRFFHRNWKEDDFVRLDRSCEKGFVQISYPLISPDRKKVLWNFQHPANFLSGSGGTYLYVKQNGHWVSKKGFDQWVATIFKK
jgi:hypothetical protein